MTENQPQEQPSTTSAELTIVDLQNLRAIIEVASKRGAFGAGEMAAIGGAFNKLDTFIKSVAPEAPSETPVDPAAAV